MVDLGRTGDDERLRRIEAIIDTAPSQLDLDGLLNDLLERVRDLLAVDTAVVLVRDVHAQQLVATAAKGLEEEVRRGVRIRIGSGFAGRVARDGRPVIIDDLHPSDVVNPLLVQKGIRSLLGVPIFGHGEVIGVLHVGCLRPRRFTVEDIALLQLVAERAGRTIQARVSAMDRSAALALQRGLLPTQLPEVPGVELAARYVPGHDTGVGGDWYDVFGLPSGWLGVVVGDVAGHGLRSAVVMGRLRSALRAYTLICDDPADALTHLDRKMHHFEAGTMATALYAMIPPDRGRVHFSLAGHPPPLLADTDGKVEVLNAPADFPLGIGRGPSERRNTVVEFQPGAVLVCYTDGLIERRGEHIEAGLGRLRASVTTDPAETVCTAIMASVGVEAPADDVALVTIRRPPG